MYTFTSHKAYLPLVCALEDELDVQRFGLG